jgi:hypothetical protein
VIPIVTQNCVTDYRSIIIASIAFELCIIELVQVKDGQMTDDHLYLPNLFRLDQFLS